MSTWLTCPIPVIKKQQHKEHHKNLATIHTCSLLTPTQTLLQSHYNPHLLPLFPPNHLYNLTTTHTCSLFLFSHPDIATISLQSTPPPSFPTQPSLQSHYNPHLLSYDPAECYILWSSRSLSLMIQQITTIHTCSLLWSSRLLQSTPALSYDPADHYLLWSSRSLKSTPALSYDPADCYILWSSRSLQSTPALSYDPAEAASAAPAEPYALPCRCTTHAATHARGLTSCV